MLKSRLLRVRMDANLADRIGRIAYIQDLTFAEQTQRMLLQWLVEHDDVVQQAEDNLADHDQPPPCRNPARSDRSQNSWC